MSFLLTTDTPRQMNYCFTSFGLLINWFIRYAPFPTYLCLMAHLSRGLWHCHSKTDFHTFCLVSTKLTIFISFYFCTSCDKMLHQWFVISTTQFQFNETSQFLLLSNYNDGQFKWPIVNTMRYDVKVKLK